MGKRGPAPKPTALRLIDGDPPSRLPKNEPQPRPELPACPDGVSDQVRAVWDYTVDQLDAMDLARSADRDALLVYCDAVVLHRRVSRKIAREGPVITGLHGGPVRHPAVQVQRDAAMTIAKYAAEFGLTPSSRTRVEAPKRNHDGEDANPFAGTG